MDIAEAIPPRVLITKFITEISLVFCDDENLDIGELLYVVIRSLYILLVKVVAVLVERLDSESMLIAELLYIVFWYQIGHL